MEPSNQVDKFLKELSVSDFEKFEVISLLRRTVLDMLPDTKEAFKYGGIMFSLNDSFGGLFVSKKHVSFEFTYGYKLSSELKLEGNGKYRRHLKFKVKEDIVEDSIKTLLEQIKSLDEEQKLPPIE